MLIAKLYWLEVITQPIIGKINYIYAALWKVKIGKKCSFYGRTYFNRTKNSKISIGSNCTFRSSPTTNWIGVDRPCMISTQESPYHAFIEIGNDCGFSGTVIGAFKGIKIGNNVRCGANTLITDSDWHLDDRRMTPPKDVVIEDNVWLGVNSIVLKGVKIGANAIIGANSVVSKNIPENVIAAGNPCKVIKTINKELLAKD